jgi:hypothetical protein
MSVSTVAHRLTSPNRMQASHMVGVLLLAIGMVAVVVAIATSSTTSSAGKLSARPAAINATPSPSAGGATPSVPGGTFRDPVTHALLAAGSPAAPQAEPGLGHR